MQKLAPLPSHPEIQKLAPLPPSPSDANISPPAPLTQGYREGVVVSSDSAGTHLARLWGVLVDVPVVTCGLWEMEGEGGDGEEEE